MKTVLLTLLSAAAFAAVGGAAFVYSGVFNVAATDPHWEATYWLMEKARIRSIQTHAAGLVAPAGYDQEAKIQGAVGHFSEHCATCHGGPGVNRDAIAQGMYPQPPNLQNVASRYTPGELFWILKNGIKMSAMPSMADDGDELLWNTVALLQKMPGMTDEQYNDLWMASQAQGGMAGMNHGNMTMPMDHGGMNMPMDHGSMNMGASPGPAAGAAAPSQPGQK
jgi:mono/diheme cytochrome c family protein